MDKLIPLPEQMKILSPARYLYTAEDARRIADDTLPEEGYRLLADGDGLKIYCSSDKGFFYGKITAEWLSMDGEMPHVEIVDRPVFRHRGFMIDTARHFFPVEVLLKRIDVASKLKLNVFHWHLTDDQGWRAETEGYPRLTEIGSYRTGTRGDGKPVKGFYTKEDMKKVVEFAAERYISVMPEVDIPGHMSAAIASYPALGCDGKEIAVKDSFGIHENVLCAGKESSYRFIDCVIDELTEIFPYKYFHIGGDEALRLKWLDCEDCQNKMAEEGLADEDELQAYMMNYAAKKLAEKGRVAVVWNDGMRGDNISDEIVMQYWKDDAASRKAAVRRINEGHKAIISPFFSYYFDYPYAMTPLKRCFGCNPVLKGINASSVVGVEGELWTEYVDDEEKMDLRLYPRLAVIAERGWAKYHTDYRSFRERLPAAYNMFDNSGVKYAKIKEADPNPFKRLVDMIKFGSAVLDATMMQSMERQKLNKKRLKEKYPHKK